MTESNAASPPTPAVRKSVWQMAGEILNHGGPGYLQFAINNICNAKCGFCGFARDKFDPQLRHGVSLTEAKDAIDICARNQIGHILFVGGEPMAHRDIVDMVAHATQRGLRPMICSNGSLWTEENMAALARAGLRSVIMSIDAPDAKRHETNRGLPGVCQKIKKANAVFRKLGLPTTASITASRLIEDYGKLPEFLRSLGFDNCTFSYPLNTLPSGYLSFSDSRLVSYAADELAEVFETIKSLKTQSDFPIMNPAASLVDMQRHVRGETERFSCLGGYKYFYLDWHLNLFRCHAWDKPICRIYDFDQSKLVRDGCTKCMIDCYRDPSVLQFVAVNAADAWRNLKRGKLPAAAKNILDRRNWHSLRAIWQEREWIRQF